MDNVFHQPQGGNEMQRLSASRWISEPHSVPERVTDRAIFVPNR